MSLKRDHFFKDYPEVPLSLLNQSGVEAFLTIIKEFTGLQLLVTTIRFDVLFETDKNEIQAFEHTLKHISYKGNILDKALKSETIYPISTGETDLSVQCLLYQEKVVGYLFLFHAAPLDDNERQFIGEFSNILIPWVVSEINMQENDQNYQQQFLFDLLHNHFDSYLDMNEQAKRWGWNFTTGHQLIIIENKSGSDTLLIVKKYTELFFMKNSMKVITAIFDHHLTVMYQPDPDKKTSGNMDVKTMAAELLRHLTSLEIVNGLKMGTGHFYPSPLYLYRSYQEAKMAIKLLGQEDEKNQIIHYDDLGIIKLLGHLRHELLADYQQEQLSKLIEFDFETDEVLTDTLEHYLKHNGNIKSCASSLHIHPNTLRYRLTKIESVLAVDLKNYQDVAELMIAFLIRNSR